MLENRLYLPRRKLPERYTVTPMTIYRWERDPLLAFPQAMIVNGKKFYDVDELEAWEKMRGPPLSLRRVNPGRARPPTQSCRPSARVALCAGRRPRTNLSPFPQSRAGNRIRGGAGSRV